MNAIVVDGLGKQFRHYRDRGALARRLRSRATTRRAVQTSWALRDVSFTVPRGGTLGVVGRNGSGKTTLLRLLSGVSGPSEGRLQVRGRIAPMIGIGVGFNRELTGRENVLVNGRLLGMSADHVAARFDDIVAFAQLADHIDVPVKFYSSGMFLRLAFSVAVHTDPDVLLVDEILAVGDVAFQNRSFERMRALQEAGTTVVVVTHNLQVLQQITPRTLVLEDGRVVHDGDTEAALEVYHRVLQRGGGAATPATVGDTTFDQRATVTVTLEDGDGLPTSQLAMRRPAQVRVQVSFTDTVVDPVVVLVLELPGRGYVLFATANAPRGSDHVHGPDRPLEAVVRLGDVPLLPQTYTLRAQVRSELQEVVHGMSDPLLIHVSGTEAGHGVAAMEPSMEIDGEPVEVLRPRLGR